jgi:hypothetical protein
MVMRSRVTSKSSRLLERFKVSISDESAACN